MKLLKELQLTFTITGLGWAGLIDWLSLAPTAPGGICRCLFNIWLALAAIFKMASDNSWEVTWLKVSK